MAQKTNIEWTDFNWNPIRGCSRVSAGCDNCYAITTAHRFSGECRPYEGLTVIRNGRMDWSSKVTLIEKDLFAPLGWKKPRKIFVASMSDPFHHNVPDEYLDKMFAVMALCPQHTFQLLTKRPERMLQYFSDLNFRTEMIGIEAERISGVSRYELILSSGKEKSSAQWPMPLPNVWLGVSVEDQATADERIPLLLQTPTAVRWISAEPLLGPIDLSDYLNPVINARHNSADLDWVVVGGESGKKARSLDINWVRGIIQQCNSANVPVFVKQLGAMAYESPGHEGATGYFLTLKNKKGGDMSEWPEDIRVREWPV